MKQEHRVLKILKKQQNIIDWHNCPPTLKYAESFTRTNDQLREKTLNEIIFISTSL